MKEVWFLLKCFICVKETGDKKYIVEWVINFSLVVFLYFLLVGDDYQLPSVEIYVNVKGFLYMFTKFKRNWRNKNTLKAEDNGNNLFNKLEENVLHLNQSTGQ